MTPPDRRVTAPRAQKRDCVSCSEYRAWCNGSVNDDRFAKWALPERLLASDEVRAVGVGDRGGPRIDTELGQDVGDVGADGSRRDIELCRDVRGRLPSGEQPKDVDLPWSEY